MASQSQKLGSRKLCRSQDNMRDLEVEHIDQ